MKCPKCRRYIRDGSTSHLCGWDVFQAPAGISCAHEGCNESAVLQRKLPHGLANLCGTHDLRHVQQEADDFCRENGLTTRVAQIEFLRKKLNTPGLLKNTLKNLIREPGEDREEVSCE